MYYQPSTNTTYAGNETVVDSGVRYGKSVFQNEPVLNSFGIYKVKHIYPNSDYYTNGALTKTLVGNLYEFEYAAVDRPLADVKAEASFRTLSLMRSLIARADELQRPVDFLSEYGLSTYKTTLTSYRAEVYEAYAQRLRDIDSCTTVQQIETIEQSDVVITPPSPTWDTDIESYISGTVRSITSANLVTRYATLADLKDLRDEILGHQDTHYITLDGVDDYISLTGTGNCMDLSHGANWTLGFTVDQNYVGNSDKFSPIQSGANNWTLYNGGLHSTIGDAVNALHWNTAAYAQGIAAGDKIILRADGTHIQFWWNNVQKHQATLGSANVGAGTPNTLTIGNATTSATIGAVPNWNASIDNLLICSGQALDFSEMAEFFNSNDFDNYSFKNTKMTDFVTMGEDEYPNVTGDKNIVTGTLVNGTSGNFVQR